MKDITVSQTRENYNKVEGTQFLSWVSLSYSLLLLVNVPLVISELVIQLRINIHFYSLTYKTEHYVTQIFKHNRRLSCLV